MMFGSVRGRGGIRLAGVRISMEGWGGMPQGVALTPIIPPPLVNEIQRSLSKLAGRRKHAH